MSTKNQHNVDYILKRLMYAKKFNTFQQVADFLGVDNRTLSAWKQRNSKIAVQKISAKCSDFDLNWLLTGDGEMRWEGKTTATLVKKRTNRELLERILEAMQSLENLDKDPPTPKTQADHIAFFYDILIDYYNSKEVTPESIAKFMSMFSGLSQIAVEKGFASQPDTIESILRAILESGHYPGIGTKKI